MSLASALALTLALVLAACGSPPDAAPPADAPPSSPAPPAAATGPALFVEAAAASGLDFVHWNGMVGKLYYAEMMGAGAALFDYDNDGDLDVYLVQGNLLDAGDTVADALVPPPGPLPLSDRLFRNDLAVAADADGVVSRVLRFTDVTAEAGIVADGYGMGVAAADFDGDGWIDLYVTNLGRNQLLRNRGGRFTDVTDEVTGGSRFTVAAAALDYDQDGRVDLFVGGYVDYAPATDKRCTDELGTPNYCGPLAYPALPDTLLHNRGDGRFADVSVAAGVTAEYGRCLGVGVGDFDGDGRLDLYVANDATPNQLWLNRGDGRFANEALLAGAAVNGQGVPEAGMGVAVADFDADGDEDIFTSHLTNETNTLFVNDGQGYFTDASTASGLGVPSWPYTGFGTGWLDVDRDGRLDQLTVNGAVKVIKALVLAGDPFPLHQRNLLLRQRADGTFEDVSERAGAALALSEVSRGAAFGDVDNDGDTDVVINNDNGPVRLLLGQGGEDGRWLGLRLTDAAGRRDALGARVVLRLPDGTAQWRRIGTDGSYASARDPRALFALGSAAGPLQVRVEWPGGDVEDFDGLAAGSYAVLRRGSGRAVAEGR